jgi:hypothetical protein
VRGVVFVDDRSAVHVIPRAEVRHVEVVSLGGDDWALKYQLAGAVVVRAVEWKGESRPESLKDKIDVGGYNQIAAGGLLTMITRGHRDIHLERRADNVFLVRSGLIEDDARVVLCRQFIVDMVSRIGLGTLDYRRQTMLHEIRAAACDLALPDGYAPKEDPR